MDDQTFEVYYRLIKLAMASEKITYSELAKQVGLPSHGHQLGTRLGKVLDRINQYEHSHGRPLISALVVSAAYGSPGEGFYDIARYLERMSPSESEGEFWQKELENIKKTWS